ncbi:hypothetical protein HPB50_008572 [Hyalomma asiaticum]|uniref:Uncharacterized protein n=1 Tax=Hyalomma asiaticum TaxID=266040 RepID=A0ACB7RW62_HYAAI|nr:hypothetical protein HPB50_008572 [Hyalomma asiaticum]
MAERAVADDASHEAPVPPARPGGQERRRASWPMTRAQSAHVTRQWSRARPTQSASSTRLLDGRRLPRLREA